MYDYEFVCGTQFDTPTGGASSSVVSADIQIDTGAHPVTYAGQDSSFGTKANSSAMLMENIGDGLDACLVCGVDRL